MLQEKYKYANYEICFKEKNKQTSIALIGHTPYHTQLNPNLYAGSLHCRHRLTHLYSFHSQILTHTLGLMISICGWMCWKDGHAIFSPTSSWVRKLSFWRGVRYFSISHFRSWEDKDIFFSLMGCCVCVYVLYVSACLICFQFLGSN